MNEKPIVNPYTFEEEPWIMKRYEKIASFIEGKKALDLGCGKGRLKMVAGKNIDFYGIDIEDKNIEICKKLGYASVLRQNIDQEEKLLFENEYFSTVACLDILEHLYYPAKTRK